jgi:hypothetical protein
MQLVLDVHSTFLDILHSTTAGYLPPSALEVRHAETTTSASHVETHLQAAPAEEFPENRDVAEQLACHPADSGPRQCPLRCQPKLLSPKLIRSRLRRALFQHQR